MLNEDLRKGIKALKAGELIVYPTDTLYALGADVFNTDAIKKVFEVKQRPSTEPLPIAVASLQDIEKIAIVNETITKIVKKFLPGPLTVVVKKKPNVLDHISGGRDSIAVRIPKSQVALELLSQIGPLTVTSANIHNQQPAGDIIGIQQQLQGKNISVFLDVGCLDGKPSTIVDLTGEKPLVLRAGVITEKEIQDAITNG
jgi:L-threonylcarbamoyladenylate synthase